MGDNANDVQSKLELSSTTESENKPSMKSIDCQTSAVIETTIKSENDEIKVDANQAPTTKRKISSTLNRRRKTSLSATRHAMEHYCNCFSIANKDKEDETTEVRSRNNPKPENDDKDTNKKQSVVRAGGDLSFLCCMN